MPDTVADIRSRAEGAILATATGDALGWPQEDRGRRVGAPREVEPKLEFVEWRRRDGGRYASHEEIIGPGAYSDDTQLVLAVARALQAGDEWWERLTKVELPFWLFYERGGGAASKRSARAWAGRNAPWDERRDLYFAAGGNGVAMRVLPHALRGSQSDDFSTVAVSVVKDGITTHGHPVALVGALAYAYALWVALRRESVLEYGSLINEVQEAAGTWSPLTAELPPEWREAADADSDGEYETRWNETVAAMVDLLSIAAGGMEQGALSVDRETLEQLGAFEQRISGAGTVSAASAVFLASRYASRPAQGLVAAAFAHGTDTDTLAAMAGGLLGAINGRDWLDVIGKRVQDHQYLLAVARALVKPNVDPPPSARPQDLRRLWRRLAETTAAAEVALPDGRNGVLERIVSLPTATRHEINVHVVRTTDGQTLFLKKVTRLTKAPQEQPSSDTAPETDPKDKSNEPTAATATQPRRRRAVVAVEAADVEQSIGFYRDLIGLELTRRTPEYVSFGGVVVIVPSNGGSPIQVQLDLDHEKLFQGQPKILVFVASDELEPLRQNLARAAVPMTAISPGVEGRRRFSCIDPDGTVVEVREANGSG